MNREEKELYCIDSAYHLGVASEPKAIKEHTTYVRGLNDKELDKEVEWMNYLWEK